LASNSYIYKCNAYRKEGYLWRAWTAARAEIRAIYDMYICRAYGLCNKLQEFEFEFEFEAKGTTPLAVFGGRPPSLGMSHPRK
jgi:hypothetical protein